MPTQIVQRQIADSAINNAKIQALAAIDTTKLAEGAEFVKRNGTVPFTAAINAGNNNVNNVATATLDTQAPNLLQVKALIDNLSSLYKYKSARVAATANVVLATPGAIHDGTTLAISDRLLLTFQTTQADNGIWIYNGASTPLTRGADADTWDEFTGCTVSINEGTANADSRWFCPANDGGVVGTTALTFSKDVTAALNSSNFVDKEIPTGLINSVNTLFVLANTPTLGTEHVYLNGVLQESGAGNDYTISGANITFLSVPLTGEKIRVTYRK